ncbi:MAG: hypothetical protein PVS3B3_39050 [Ktedonobacteraceae bacterium]
MRPLRLSVRTKDGKEILGGTVEEALNANVTPMNTISISGISNDTNTTETITVDGDGTFYSRHAYSALLASDTEEQQEATQPLGQVIAPADTQEVQ